MNTQPTVTELQALLNDLIAQIANMNNASSGEAATAIGRIINGSNLDLIDLNTAFTSFYHNNSQNYNFTNGVDSLRVGAEADDSTLIVDGDVGSIGVLSLADDVTLGVDGNVGSLRAYDAYDFTGLITGDLGSAHAEEARGLSLTIDGKITGTISTFDSADIDLKLAVANGALLDLHYSSGVVNIDTFYDGVFRTDNFDGSINVGAADGGRFQFEDTDLSTLSIDGDEMNVFADQTRVETLELSGEGISGHFSEVSGENWNFEGMYSNFFLNEAVLRQLIVDDPMNVITVSDSLIDFAAIGQGSDLHVYGDSQVTAALKGSNYVTVNDSGLLVFAQNGQRDTIVLEDGASLTGQLDWFDMIQIEQITTTAGNLARLNDGEGQFGGNEWDISIDPVPLIGIAGGGSITNGADVDSMKG